MTAKECIEAIILSNSDEDGDVYYKIVHTWNKTNLSKLLRDCGFLTNKTLLRSMDEKSCNLGFYNPIVAEGQTFMIIDNVSPSSVNPNVYKTLYNASTYVLTYIVTSHIWDGDIHEEDDGYFSNNFTNEYKTLIIPLTDITVE